MVALPTSPIFNFGATSPHSHTGRLLRPSFSPRGILTLGLLSGLLLLLVSSSMMSGSMQDELGLETHFHTARLGNLIKHYTWSSTREPANMTEYICPECDCTIPGYYSLSPRFSSPLPSLDEARKPGATKRTIKRYLLSEISHYLWMNPVFLPPTALAPLFQSFFTCPDNLIRLNFKGLEYGKPTTYMYTRTGDGGRLKANERRLRYFQRHIDTLKEYNRIVELEGFFDGAKAKDRQLIWILIEDNDHLNEDLNNLMNSTGLPYLYFAHGPTHYYGNAQWNAAERAVHILRDSFFGDGPVMNVDDDSRILPDLLRLVWKVKKLIMWQVGNLGWEGPVFTNGKITDWKIAGLPQRKFPIDMGGKFVIGDGRAVSPPSYLPENHFGGESEFISQIIKSRDEIEALCENSSREKCHYSWHNWNEDKPNAV
ncbi:glycosyltransferase family 43 protein [Cystobasidium minutum MCA 4210]|uniref:glycosyltransferase family 43 protein n=1 Tax=Cystobasidium minutum MCA 4210 TaxID=1397322 RepID=UPI0034CE7651|eukprot:jgi/Rhomi1/193611/gm1.1825_g